MKPAKHRVTTEAASDPTWKTHCITATRCVVRFERPAAWVLRARRA